MSHRKAKRERTEMAKQTDGGTIIGRRDTFEFRSSPLPSPEELAQLEAVVPGAAKMLLDRFEKQGNHRMHLEQEVVIGNIRRERTGMNYALTVALSGFALTGFLGYINQPAVAGIIGGLDLIGLVGIFVYGRQAQQKEREEKQKLSPSRS